MFGRRLFVVRCAARPSLMLVCCGIWGVLVYVCTWPAVLNFGAANTASVVVRVAETRWCRQKLFFPSIVCAMPNPVREAAVERGAGRSKLYRAQGS